MKKLTVGQKERLAKGWNAYRHGDPYPEDLPTCIVPWTSIALAANGNIKPCCVFKHIHIPEEHHPYDESGATVKEPNFYKGFTLERAHEQNQWLRKEFIAKRKPEACGGCWKNEDALGASRRQWMLEKIKDPPKEYTVDTPLDLRHMDLNFGNTCNLKCRMCGSWGSTHWFKEDVKLNDINRDFERAVNHAQPKSIDSSYWLERPHYFKNMERIDFKGGEPFMQQGHYDVLQMLVDNGSAKNVELGYVTNGTKTPELLKDLWPHFKRIVLNVSVEASTSGLYEYIRGGNTQTIEQLEKSIYWYDQFDNIKGNFSVAISILNVFDLENLSDWMEHVTVNTKHWKTLVADRTSDHWKRYERPVNFAQLVTDPRYLDLNIMPMYLKEAVLARWTKKYHALDVLRERLTVDSYDEKNWNLFKQFTSELDRMRGTNIVDHIPEMAGEF